VGNLFAIVAFVLLWLFLVPFFYALLRALAGRRRKGSGWEHGL
jgi:hypothetical protein